MKKLFKKNNNGFTLVETLVALSIFTASVLAMLIILSQGLTQTSFAKNKLVATYLAQEGIEYFRNTRDNHMLYGTNGWDTFQKVLDQKCSQAEGCGFIDLSFPFDVNNDVFSCIDKNNCELGLLEGKYSSLNFNPQTGNIDSGFRRVINTISYNKDTIHILSTVYWYQSSVEHSVSFSEDLFNWY
ncbi:MAG: prepilin-type N-terminal cleavage/methylation domain-containing protein [Patescibacteria group bacterium]